VGCGVTAWGIRRARWVGRCTTRRSNHLSVRGSDRGLSYLHRFAADCSLLRELRGPDRSRRIRCATNCTHNERGAREAPPCINAPLRRRWSFVAGLEPVDLRGHLDACTLGHRLPHPWSPRNRRSAPRRLFSPKANVACRCDRPRPSALERSNTHCGVLLTIG
jgi:hypothetical protein